jgi:hypothetical protein
VGGEACGYWRPVKRAMHAACAASRRSRSQLGGTRQLSSTSMRDMNDLPDDVMREIREHVAAARVEWELWLRDREEQRLRRILFDDSARRDACDE